MRPASTHRYRNRLLCTASPESPAQAPAPPLEPEEDKKGAPPPESEPDVNLKLSRAIVWASYALFGYVSYSGALGPSEGFESSVALEQLKQLNFADMNIIFLGMFCLIGATAINLAVLLNSGATRQPKWLPTELFTIPQIVLGFVTLAPYLALRKFVPGFPPVTKQEVTSRSFINAGLEWRGTAILNVVQAIASYALGFGLFLQGSELWHDMVFFSQFVDFIRDLSTDKLVYNSTVDFLFLTLFTWGPLTEDMRRRGWFTGSKNFESNLTAFAIMFTPALGPALYLALRPSLPDENQLKSTDKDDNQATEI